MASYTRQQIYLLSALTFSYLCCALCGSLQAPFFPQEAERKGATPSQYGLIFGVFDLTLLFMTPTFGKYIPIIGPKFLATSGLFLVGGGCILFGQLDKFTDTTMFIGFAFAIRIVESVGFSAFFISLFSIVAGDFQENFGSVFSLMEGFFGFGMIIGPTVGGALYNYGGYSLPFEVLGCVLLISFLVLLVILPSDKNDQTASRASFIGVLKVDYMILSVLVSTVTCYGLGCIEVGLAHHLTPMQLDPLQIGLVFISYGAMYAISTPIWGIVVDKLLSAKMVSIIGLLLMIISLIFLGPAPYVPMKPRLWLIIVSLLIQGIGLGAGFVGSFVIAMSAATSSGMPDNVSTYGIISGLFMCSVGIGFFTGPSLSGYIMDVLDFSWATFIAQLFQIAVIFLFLLKKCQVLKTQNRTIGVNKEGLIDGRISPYGTFVETT